MLTKTKPFSILRAPSLGFSKDLLNDPRIIKKCDKKGKLSCSIDIELIFGFCF